MVKKDNPKCANYAIVVTAEENEYLKTECKKSGLTRGEFIMRCVKGNPVICIDHVFELVLALKKQINTMNAALRLPNLTDEAAENLSAAVAEARETYKTLMAGLEGVKRKCTSL